MVAGVCALLGGFAAFAATLGGPALSQAPAASIAPGNVTGTLDPGGTGTAPGGTAPGGTAPGGGGTAPAVPSRAAPTRR